MEFLRKLPSVDIADVMKFITNQLFPLPTSLPSSFRETGDLSR